MFFCFIFYFLDDNNILLELNDNNDENRFQSNLNGNVSTNHNQTTTTFKERDFNVRTQLKSLHNGTFDNNNTFADKLKHNRNKLNETLKTVEYHIDLNGRWILVIS